MRKPSGYGQLTGPGGLPTPQTSDEGIQSLYIHGEADSFTCAHCQHVTLVPPRMDAADMGGLCRLCMKPICKHCLGKGCTPWEKQLEITEARYHALRSYGMT